MKTKIVIIIISSLLFFTQVHTIENNIILKINNKIITSIDIQNEINYLNSINPTLRNLENDKMLEISKNSLIRVKIKEIALEKVVSELKIDKSDFERNLILNYSNIGIKNLNELQDHLLQFNIDIQTLEERIAIESYWNQVIYDLYNKNIKIDLEEIKKYSENNMQNEFLLSEIVFNLDVNENSDEKT